MRRFANLAELATCQGSELGVGEWFLIDQPRVDDFARVAGDDLWIHVDTERARLELPQGATIVHGFLMLSMMTALAKQLWSVDSLRDGALYGLDRVRFPSSVATGSSVRLCLAVESAEFTDKGLKITFENVIEVSGSSRPAVVARSTSVLREAA